MHGKRYIYLAIILIALTIALMFLVIPTAGYSVTTSALSRNRVPDVSIDDQNQVIHDNTQFAIDMYHELEKETGNIVFSPYSISFAMAMAFAGARGETERLMAETLRFTLPQDRFHPAFNSVDLDVQRNPDHLYSLDIANSIWAQNGWSWQEAFLDTLAVNYGAGIYGVDFSGEPENCRMTINNWVEEKTHDYIKDFFPPGTIDAQVLIVGVNAVYFEAEWLKKFDSDQTTDDRFTLLDGDSVNVRMMNQTDEFNYAEFPDFQVLEMLYAGETKSMVILLPELVDFEEFENTLTADLIDEIYESLENREVIVALPKFELRYKTSLVEILSRMGMPNAFDGADFSGMDGTNMLFISEILHEAYVKVDEEKTVAAAATGWAMRGSAAPSFDIHVFRADHPFIYLIRDLETDSILFLGRVLDPSQAIDN